MACRIAILSALCCGVCSDVACRVAILSLPCRGVCSDVACRVAVSFSVFRYKKRGHARYAPRGNLLGLLPCYDALMGLYNAQDVLGVEIHRRDLGDAAILGCGLDAGINTEGQEVQDGCAAGSPNLLAHRVAGGGYREGDAAA